MTEIKSFFSNLKNVAPGTWVRLALLIAALVNTGAKIFGFDIMPGENQMLEKAATVIIMVIAALTAYWKNNSFTEAAVAADEIMKTLKK